MRHDPDDRFTDADLEASLGRLGVREIEERMELSPLLADAGIGETDGCSCSCRCDSVPPEDGGLPHDFENYLPRMADPNLPG